MSALKDLAKRILPEPAVSALSRYRYSRRFHGYRPKQTTQHYGPWELTVELVDRLGEGWYGHDWELPAEISLLERSRLKPGAVVFDLGAHQCVMAMVLARTVGPNGFVLAVEGGSTNAGAGTRNVQLNAISNCTVIHAVAAAKSEPVRFDGMGNGHVIADTGKGTVYWPEVVQAYSLDDLAAAHGCPDVVYVDVEGCECEVLEGAGQTLLTKPDWFIEVHSGAGLENHGGSVDRLLSALGSGYLFYVSEPTKANDYSNWNSFELLEKAGYPPGRFYLVAIAKTE